MESDFRDRNGKYPGVEKPKARGIMDEMKKQIIDRVIKKLAQLECNGDIDGMITDIVQETISKRTAAIVEYVVKEKVKILVNKEISSLTDITGWGEDNAPFNDKVTELIIKAAPMMFEKIMRSVVMNTISNMNTNMY